LIGKVQMETKEPQIKNSNITSTAPPLKITNSLGMEFVYVKPGSFMMGSPANESGRYDDETQHRVTLSKGFYMQTTEVTQGQWRAIMGSSPSRFSNCGDDCPVEKVSWTDIQEFISKLNQIEVGSKYRLPTEAEWEYAARAGSTARFCYGDDEGRLSEYAWYSGNSGDKTHPVAQKQPNAWGLYDMHGNVYEWCQDWYDKNYPSGNVTDPTGPSSGSLRVLCGGSWSSLAEFCRSAIRYGKFPVTRNLYLGFRLAREL
jgi:formylglycine-generating enzyme required for sulfatase activity